MTKNIPGIEILENIKISILLLEPETGVIRFANPAACSFYGYSRAILEKMNIGQINPKPLSETLNNLKLAFSGQQDYYCTLHKTSTGEDLYVGIYSGPYKTEDEKLLIALIHDNSANKEADERLRSLSRAVQQSPATIVITDKLGNIEYANPQFEITTGYTVAEALGKNTSILKTGGGDRSEIRELWQTILSGKVWRGEFCNRKKDGNIYWESASISPVLDENSEIMKFVAVKEDITEKKKFQNQIEESLQFNQAILDISPIGIMIFNATGQCFHANPAAGKILGASTESLLEQNFHSNIKKGHGLFTLATEAIDKNEPLTSEFPCETPGGKAVWLDGICAPFVSGKERNLLFMFEDITYRKESESELRKATDELKETVNKLERRDREATLLREMGETLQVCNHIQEALQVIINFGNLLFPNSNGTFFMANESQKIVESVCAWAEGVSSEPVFSYDECWALKRNQLHSVVSGSTDLVCSHMSTSFKGSYIGVPLAVSGEMIGLLHVEWPDQRAIDQETREFVQNVGELVSLSISNIRLRETLRNQSIRDPLTGVFNRRYMEETLSREISRATRKKALIGIMMMDIDHFKKFNDNYGHEAGDVVLKEVSQLVQSAIRREDILCRYGGEEFIVILPDANREVTAQRAELLRQKISTLKLEHDNRPLGSITMSIGVSVFPENGEAGDDIVQAADKALYRAKEEGRNQVCVA